MPRIVSCLASATEILCALGLESQMVGRSHECDHPTSILRLPICTETKFKTDGSSYDIDQRIKAILQEGLSVYKVRADILEELAPDFIVTQVQCEVCAVSLKDLEEAACQLISSKPRIVTLNPNSLDDIWTDVRCVARALNAEPRGETVIADLKARMAKISQKAQAQPARPRVAYIEWMEPLMAGGNWMPTLIEMAGGISLFGKAGKHSPWMSWEELRGADPDVIIISPCGFDIARTRRELNVLSSLERWSEMKAVTQRQVYLADGNHFFNRPGPRIVESLEILAEILHPEAFDSLHQAEIGWQRS